MHYFKAPAAALIIFALAACTPPEPGAPGAARAAGDACGAEALQPLVGTSVGTLDPATLPEPNRVLFPGQAATTDFRDERLNVEIGADDRVARVFCG